MQGSLLPRQKNTVFLSFIVALSRPVRMRLLAISCYTPLLWEYLRGECTHSQMLGTQNSVSGVHTPGTGPMTQALIRDERAAAVAEVGGRVDG